MNHVKKLFRRYPNVANLSERRLLGFGSESMNQKVSPTGEGKDDSSNMDQFNTERDAMHKRASQRQSAEAADRSSELNAVDSSLEDAETLDTPKVPTVKELNEILAKAKLNGVTITGVELEQSDGESYLRLKGTSTSTKNALAVIGPLNGALADGQYKDYKYLVRSEGLVYIPKVPTSKELTKILKVAGFKDINITGIDLEKSDGGYYLQLKGTHGTSADYIVDCMNLLNAALKGKYKEQDYLVRIDKMVYIPKK